MQMAVVRRGALELELFRRWLWPNPVVPSSLRIAVQASIYGNISGFSRAQCTGANPATPGSTFSRLRNYFNPAAFTTAPTVGGDPKSTLFGNCGVGIASRAGTAQYRSRGCPYLSQSKSSAACSFARSSSTSPTLQTSEIQAAISPLPPLDSSRQLQPTRESSSSHSNTPISLC